jgi:hypothetical protein
MGLAGSVLIVAALVGGLVYQSHLPASGDGVANPPPEVPAAIAPTKKYSAASAQALGDAMRKIAQELDGDGVNTVRDIDVVASGPTAASTKQQIYEMIGRLDRLRNKARAVGSIIWNDVLPAYPDFSEELREIVHDKEPVTSLEGASKIYFDGLTTVASLYDKFDAATKDQVLQLLSPAQDTFRHAASNFGSWMQGCKSRIEEKQAELH